MKTEHIQEPVRVALVGCGYWGEKLARVFSSLSHAHLVALCDSDAERMETIVKQRGEVDVRLYTSYEALLGANGIDAVVLATPPSQHFHMAERALHAGRHVWVEKPLALRHTEGETLVRTAATRERVLFVDETFLYDPFIDEVRRVIEKGSLGTVHHVSLERLGLGRIRRDSNVWWNSAPHDLSILFYLLPRKVVRLAYHEHSHLQPGIADVATADLALEGGVSVHIYLSWMNPEKTATLTVVGADRMLTYEGRHGNRRLTLYDYGLDRREGDGGGTDGTAIIPVTHLTKIPVEGVPDAEPLRAAAEEFVGSIRRGTEPRTSGRNSLPVLALLEAAQRATDGERPGI